MYFIGYQTSQWRRSFDNEDNIGPIRQFPISFSSDIYTMLATINDIGGLGNDNAYINMNKTDNINYYISLKYVNSTSVGSASETLNYPWSILFIGI